MVQVCAKCLNIPVEKIHICETSTDKVPNTTPTAASVSTDLNGMAVQVYRHNVVLMLINTIMNRMPVSRY